VNLVDANVLVYAVNSADPKHTRSRTWLDGSFSAGETVGFTWVVLLAFLRLVTKVGLFPRPLAVGDAVALIRAWITHPAAVVVEPTARHLDVLAGLLTSTDTGANLVNDAHLAAIAIENDATVITFDSDFGRFSGVRWRLPSDR
jgi:toxin-antitoxin system PIN domain toxin